MVPDFGKKSKFLWRQGDGVGGVRGRAAVQFDGAHLLAADGNGVAGGGGGLLDNAAERLARSGLQPLHAAAEVVGEQAHVARIASGLPISSMMTGT